MTGHPQIIIRTPYDDGFLPPGILEGIRELPRTSQAVDFLKNPVRVILFLLNDLLLEELLVGESILGRFLICALVQLDYVLFIDFLNNVVDSRKERASIRWRLLLDYVKYVCISNWRN